jgi:hypothetical protein
MENRPNNGWTDGLRRFRTDTMTERVALANGWNVQMAAQESDAEWCQRWAKAAALG